MCGAGDGSIIYGASDGAERRLPVASATANPRRIGSRAPVTPCALSQSAQTLLSVLSLAASVTTASAVLGGSDCSDSPTPNSSYFSSDSSAIDTGRGTCRYCKKNSTHMNSKSLMDLIPSSLSLLSMASGAPVSRTR